MNLNLSLFVFSSGVEIVAKRVLDPLMHIDFIWNLTGPARRLREYARFGHELFRKVFLFCLFHRILVHYFS